MSMRHIILLLAASILLLIGASLAQLEWTWFLFLPIDSGELSEINSAPNEEIVYENIPIETGEYGQVMKEVDSGVFMTSWLDFVSSDTLLLSGDLGSGTMDFGMIDLLNNELLLTWEQVMFSWIISDSIPHLILSEVYYDGTDEWIEITNIGSWNFQGNFIISWAKSTLVSLTNISIPSGESKVFGDTMAQILNLSCIGKTGLALNITDTSSINIQLIVSGQIVDNFFVDQSLVNFYNDKKTSFEKFGENITGVDIDRVVNAQSGYIINPGKYFTPEIIIGDIPPPILQTWINSDLLPHLILSEVYYDGTDEWIEITNIGSGDFQGNFTLSWVKSTPVLLTNISISANQSKLFGDNISQVSGNVFMGKTGLAFNMTDTSSINIQIIISGQTVDNFFVDQYRVNTYNDKKTSFEKVGDITTRVQTSRIANMQSEYIINPGIYFNSGIGNTDVSFSPNDSWFHLNLPISCDMVAENSPITIDEIFPGDEKYPPYIELAISDNITLDSLSISGNRLATWLDFLFTTSGSTLEKNTLFLISSTGFWTTNEQLPGVRNSDFSLLSTWNYLLITIGSWQSRRVMDIVYLSGNTLGKSSYSVSTRYQCVRILDSLDDFSPGFDKKFLKYFPVTTTTKIEYIEVATGSQSWTGSCQTPSTVSLISWNTQMGTDISSSLASYTIRILYVDYDPEGSDTNNEKITLLATNSSGDQTPLDLSKIFRLKVNGTTKTLPRTLPMNVPTTFTKTFGFPNSTNSWQDVIIQLMYGEYIFDTYTYNPKKLSSKEEEAFTTTGYSVTSVIDWDTFRIKYEWKTQSIRLLGIDAPESNKTRYKYTQCFGTEAKNYLKSLIDKKKITFQFDSSQDQKDIYDRLLAYVFLDDQLINQTMVEDGYAKEYTYKTPYTYQSQFKQAEQSAQDQQLGLRNETTCGVSLSGVQLTGDIETTGAVLDLSGLQFTITYVLPNPKWSDKAEELWLQINKIEEGWGKIREENWGISDNLDELITGDMSIGQASSWLIHELDLSQGFSLRIGTSKKKINQIVHIGQENILSWSLWLVNKAACVSLFYQEEELTKFCYGTPKEGQKIYSSDQWLEETPQEDLTILNTLQLKKIDNKLCIWYKDKSFLCKNIPAGKAALKIIQEQKLYKWFASLVKQYIVASWKDLYYATPLKTYFDLVAENKKLIAKWMTHVDIYGQSVLVTDLKQQLKILQTTLPGIIALFEGEEKITN